MKSYTTAAIGIVMFLFAETILAMIIYIVMKYMTEIDKSALWIGCCILAGCLFISAVIAAAIGIITNQKEISA